MKSITSDTPEVETELLRRLLGRRISSVYGNAFIVEGSLVCSPRFAMYVGVDNNERKQYLTIGSAGQETPVDYLDWGRFEIGIVESVAAALGGSGRLYVDLSQMEILEDVQVHRVRVRRAWVKGPVEEVRYDAYIALDLTDGRVLSFGHAPRVYEGACVTLGEPQTLGDPKHIEDRVIVE